MLPIIISDAERKNSLDILWEREENSVGKNLKYNFLIVFLRNIKSGEPEKVRRTVFGKEKGNTFVEQCCPVLLMFPEFGSDI